MTYTPKPLATDDIELSAQQAQLVEKLAENAHEVWAQKRVSDGWTWGPERNDGEKKHPCLVPYGELPESEKDYDRALVLQTIKGALALGYRVDKA